MEIYLRHYNHAEIQPVPWVPQESEWSNAESSCQNFYQWLKSVNSSKSVPGQKARGGAEKGVEK